MASGFFALLDDIALLMDDVAAMGKIATKKTAGILGDDLAVNAEKASGFQSSRELPVLWKITKGSFLNKLIILPLAFLLSAFFPAVIVPILLIGGIYLSFEGAEKIHHFLFLRNRKKESTNSKTLSDDKIQAIEKKKIKSAILVDFILSIEIVILALSTVVEEELSIQIIVVSFVAVLATIGVYGIVALIVRIDDFGYKLISLSGDEKSPLKTIGLGLVKTLPYIIRTLAFVGTIAMILVSGGIFVHNIHFMHDLLIPLPSILAEFLMGLVVGFSALLVFNTILKIKSKLS
ncbi:MAG: putative DNA repair protein MutK [Flavobacteriales bacterium]|jgi:predicted DNA repair protein MutK|tara:strand:- start:3573 stop:4445 length:873 start_codon:yes stop_codon:yes gene_type:complete